MNKLLLALLVPIGALVWWFWHLKSEFPTVPFAKVKRETLVSTLPTNGKVEPIEWEEVRAEIAGVVEKVGVAEGRLAAKGDVLAQLSDSSLQPELHTAEARLTQARADLAVIESGGKTSELTAIENELARARFDREAALREYNALRRLAEKNAATPLDVQAAQGKVREAELQIAALDRRRAALVDKMDKTVALARIRDAEAAVELARSKIAQTTIRAPLSGLVYRLAVRPGAYVNVGDVVAAIGRLERVRVRVYVDEPELGRVAVGQPVTITWTGLPGKRWNGTVEKLPAAIVAEGTRQVGQVICTIDNPGRELVPGTNVDAEIRTRVVENALTIPKEAVRRNAGGAGVLVLAADNIMHWRQIQTGAVSITRIQVTQGLSEGEAVALPTERMLKDGDRVQPVVRG